MPDDLGFFCLPRILSERKAWVDARPTHQAVFMAILLHCAYKEIEYNIQGNIIKIFPGQLCASIRQIQDWSGKWISKNDVEGSIKYFQKVDFWRQEIRHGKTVITVTQPDICKYINKNTQTTNQTEVRQGSDRGQTQKNKDNKENKEKEEQHARMRDAAKPLDESFFQEQRMIDELGRMMEELGGDSAIETKSDNIRLVANSEALTENKNNYLSSKKRSIQPSAQALDLLAQFESSIAQHVPEVSLPLKKSQAKNFDSLLKKHDAEKIKQAFHFAHQHHFWRQRIHATSDLERNFSKVLSEFNSSKIISQHHPPAVDIANGKEFETEIDPFLLKITGERVYES